MSDTTRRESPEALRIIRRAEEIREDVGCSWERACDVADGRADLNSDEQRAQRWARLERDAPPNVDTSEEPATDHGFDVCPDCGDVGVKVDSTGYVPCTRFLTCWSDPA